MEAPPLPVPEPPSMERTSLLGRLCNLYATPGDVFAEVSASKPATGNWLLPLFLSVLATVAFMLVAFSQPSVLQGIQEAQDRAIEEQVTAGKLTREQAEKARLAVAQFAGPTLMKIFGAVGGAVGLAGWLFVGAVVIWLVGAKFLGGTLNYTRALEINGLALMITLLGTIAQIPLVIVTGKLEVTLGPALLVPDFSRAILWHRMLAAVSLFSVWQMAIIALGVSRCAGVPFGRAAAWFFGLWAALTSLLALPNWG